MTGLLKGAQQIPWNYDIVVTGAVAVCVPFFRATSLSDVYIYVVKNILIINII
jgi:hypothetical protein